MSAYAGDGGSMSSEGLPGQHGVFCKGGLLSSMGLSAVGESFLVTWLAFTAVAILAVALTSGPLFYAYYWPSNVTFEKWQRKSNPTFPSPEKVRDEIIQTLKAVMYAAICPAASVWLAVHGHSRAYCGSVTPVGDGWAGLGYHVATFVGVLVFSDFYEFYYHYLGHRYRIFWENHRHHHKFFNPTPFAVIADEFIDQACAAHLLLPAPPPPLREHTARGSDTSMRSAAARSSSAQHLSC
jgi:lathosterol oxidase